MIIADENLEQFWIDLFRTKGYEVISIRQESPGVADRAIAELVRAKEGWLSPRTRILVN